MCYSLDLDNFLKSTLLFVSYQGHSRNYNDFINSRKVTIFLEFSEH